MSMYQLRISMKEKATIIVSNDDVQIIGMGPIVSLLQSAREFYHPARQHLTYCIAIKLYRNIFQNGLEYSGHVSHDLSPAEYLWQELKIAFHALPPWHLRELRQDYTD